MGFIANINELNSAKETYKSYLEEEINNSNNLNSEIENFISLVNGNDLNGKLWNATNKKVNVYKALNNQRRIAISNFKSTLESELNKLINAWKSDFGDEINDEKLAELEAEVIMLKNTIDSLYAELIETITDEHGNTSTRENPYARDAINKAEKDLAEIERIINEIKEYRALTYSAIDNIESSFTKARIFDLGAVKVVPTAMWTYTESGE